MPNYLKSISLRVAATCIAATFISIGPYLHYEKQFKYVENPDVLSGKIKHVDLSHLPYIGDIPDFNSIKDTKEKKLLFLIF